MLAEAAAVLAALAPAAPATTPPTTLLRVRPGKITPMYDGPNGRLRYRLLPRTLFDSRVVLSVTQRRGEWAAVPSFLVENGRRLWVRVDARRFEVAATTWRVRADRSSRRLTVLRGDRVVRRIRIAVGRAAAPTPLGTFAITDKLPGSRFSASAYGCCILALSGHQPKVRTGSIDGRIALHGTSRPEQVGAAVSNGCLRLRDADVRWLWRTVPVGTQLKIVA